MTVSAAGLSCGVPRIPGAPNIGGGPVLNESRVPDIGGRESDIPGRQGINAVTSPLRSSDIQMDASRKIAIGSDHAGFQLKGLVKQHLADQFLFQVTDFGAQSENSVDYPDIAHPVAEAVGLGAYSYGILICGTGLGMSIAANKARGARAALCQSTFMAEMARKHNNANILVLGARVTEADLALQILDTFLLTGFEGGRHQTRIDKIDLR